MSEQPTSNQPDMRRRTCGCGAVLLGRDSYNQHRKDIHEDGPLVELVPSKQEVPQGLTQAGVILWQASELNEAAAEIERLRALLRMAEDCLPDGDYSVRAMAAKEIREALGTAHETTAVKEQRVYPHGHFYKDGECIKCGEKDGALVASVSAAPFGCHASQ